MYPMEMGWELGLPGFPTVMLIEVYTSGQAALGLRFESARTRELRSSWNQRYLDLDYVRTRRTCANMITST